MKASTAADDVERLHLSVNDGPPTVETVKHLLKLRDSIHARQVYWVLPARAEETRGMIRVSARMHGDTVIETRGSTVTSPHRVIHAKC